VFRATRLRPRVSSRHAGPLPRPSGRSSASAGGNDRADVRVVAATNKEVKAEIAGGRFRGDLYFRLSVVTIKLPPLRERGEDIVLLAHTFLRRSCKEYRRKLQFGQDTALALAAYARPGNIRELENVVQRAVIMARGKFIEPANLGLEAPAGAGEAPRRLKEARNQLERELLLESPHPDQGQMTSGRRRTGSASRRRASGPPSDSSGTFAVESLSVDLVAQILRRKILHPYVESAVRVT
jgi:DNA-binding NtrC family response regulator